MEDIFRPIVLGCKTACFCASGNIIASSLAVDSKRRDLPKLPKVKRAIIVMMPIITSTTRISIKVNACVLFTA